MIRGSKMGDRMPLTCSGSTATTSTTWSAGSMAPKTKMKYLRLHCSRNLALRAVLHSRWLRWSGHVQRAPSSMELITDLVIPGTRRWRRTRKNLWKNNVRECGLYGIDHAHSMPLTTVVCFMKLSIYTKTHHLSGALSVLGVGQQVRCIEGQCLA